MANMLSNLQAMSAILSMSSWAHKTMSTYSPRATVYIAYHSNFVA